MSKSVGNSRASRHPGVLDTLIILLISAAAVLFLLWATSRLLGINAFEHLPDWLRESYRAIWVAGATGATGIGLAIARALSNNKQEPHPNYLLLIAITVAGMLLAIRLLPPLFSMRDGHRVYVERELTAGHFNPSSLQLPPVHGTDCGQPKMNLPGELNVKVGEWNTFQWDASYICRRQGVRGGVDGRITWGTRNDDYNKLPNDDNWSFGEWGVAKFRYLQPGKYTIAVEMSVTCIDVNVPPNNCQSSGQFVVSVTSVE